MAGLLRPIAHTEPEQHVTRYMRELDTEDEAPTLADLWAICRDAINAGVPLSARWSPRIRPPLAPPEGVSFAWSAEQGGPAHRVALDREHTTGRRLLLDNADHEEPLMVWAYTDQDADAIVIDQGGDRVFVPADQIGELAIACAFIDAELRLADGERLPVAALAERWRVEGEAKATRAGA